MTVQEVIPPANLPVVSEARQKFELQQRQARTFALSPLVPEHLRKGSPEVALANCYIALTMAEAMGELPVIVMQNIHIINGKAGFSAQYMIARANSSGIFRGRIDWRIDGSDPNNLAVTAFAILRDTEQEVSVTVDMAMARAEGWTKNAKYQSMPEVMLRYRSAAFLVRFYCPDVMLGYQTAEEVEDVRYAEGPDLSATPLSAAMLTDQAGAREGSAGETIDQETGEVTEATEVQAEAATPAQQHDEANPPPATDAPAWQALVDDLKQRLETATTRKAVDQDERDWVNNIRPFLPDDHEIIAEVEGIIARRKLAVAGKG